MLVIANLTETRMKFMAIALASVLALNSTFALAQGGGGGGGGSGGGSGGSSGGSTSSSSSTSGTAAGSSLGTTDRSNTSLNPPDARVGQTPNDARTPTNNLDRNSSDQNSPVNRNR